MIFCMEKVGYDIRQVVNGAVDSEIFIFEVGKVPKATFLTKSNHWTLLELAALDFFPVMCIVIFAEKDEVLLYKTEMDSFAEVSGNAVEKDFFDKSSGSEKIYPGGPTYLFNGKEVMCMCHWRRTLWHIHVAS